MKEKNREFIAKALKDYPFIIRSLLYHKYGFKYRSKLELKKLKLRIKGNTYLRVKYPEVLQFPVTFKCNFDCIMCGMQEIKNTYQMNKQELANLISSEIFSKIKDVGLNGGEPFLLPDIVEYISILVNNLPKLQNIYIITNGFLTDKILKDLPEIKKICSSNNIRLTVSISVDGVGNIHDKIRGRKNIFDAVEKTCLSINNNIGEYCDSFGVICTVTKENVYYLNEVEAWTEKNTIPVTYNIATIHKRLHNEGRYQDFSIFADAHCILLATEWFYYKFMQTFSQQYYAIYKYLTDGKRVANCDYWNNGITLLPNGDISYCATFSNIIGNGINGNIKDIFFDNIKYRKELMDSHCNNCSHYSTSLTISGYEEYIKEILNIFGQPSKYNTKRRR